MDQIIEPTSSFDFSKLTCISPSSITGGNYFIRILQNPKQQPFYIQPPKCTSKQGIVKTGKKMCCDLLFKHEDEAFTEFLDCLETFCRAQIFLNKDRWFDSELTENDIEESFSPTAKIYKSGKFHSVRVNIPLRLGKCSLKVYDEDQQDIDIESISDKNILTILEVQGIRCSARNFQLEYEVKQMMVLQPINIFEKCVFPTQKISLGENKIEKGGLEKTKSSEEAKEEDVQNMEREDLVLVKTEGDPVLVKTEEDPGLVKTECYENEEVNNNNNLEFKKAPLAESVLTLFEVDLEVPKVHGEITLKKRNDVYYNLYKEAKRKGRIARDFAIASYLEAKQIRHHFLDDNETLSEDDEEEDELKKKELEEIHSTFRETNNT